MITGQLTKPVWCVVSVAFLVHLGLVVALKTFRVLTHSGWMVFTAKGESQCCLVVRSLAGENMNVHVVRMLVWFVTHRFVANKKVISNSFRSTAMHHFVVACSH